MFGLRSRVKKIEHWIDLTVEAMKIYNSTWEDYQKLKKRVAELERRMERDR